MKQNVAALFMLFSCCIWSSNLGKCGPIDYIVQYPTLPKARDFFSLSFKVSDCSLFKTRALRCLSQAKTVKHQPAAFFAPFSNFFRTFFEYFSNRLLVSAGSFNKLRHLDSILIKSCPTILKN